MAHGTCYSALYTPSMYYIPFLVKGVCSSSNSGEGLSWKEHWEGPRMVEGWTVEECYNLEEVEAYTPGKMHG